MIITVEYCQYMRKDGSYNRCVIDTERKIYCNHSEACRFDEPNAYVEAHISKDVDNFRSCAIKSGYREVSLKEFSGKEKSWQTTEQH